MNRIAELRKSKHLNQTGLAMKLNISQYLVSAYETGRHQPGIETLIAMSDLFNVSVDYIIGNTNIKTKPEELAGTGLDQNEIELLSLFKSLDGNNKQRVIGFIMGLNLL